MEVHEAFLVVVAGGDPTCVAGTCWGPSQQAGLDHILGSLVNTERVLKLE
jgi:hypothetical protein